MIDGVVRQNLERLRKNRLDLLLARISLAETLLACAQTTGNKQMQDRYLQNALAVVRQAECFIDGSSAHPARLDEMRKALGSVYWKALELNRLTELSAEAAESVYARIKIIGSFASADSMHRVLAGKPDLFAGDLFRMALRFRFAGTLAKR